MANKAMKDSGIEWIGRIPINWKISKVKHIAYIQGGSGFPVKLQGKNNGKYPFYKNSDFSNNVRNLIYANNYVDDRDVIDSKLNIIPTGSIVMSKIGESMKKNHRKITTEPSVVDNNLQALILKDSKKLSLIFFYYLMSIIDSNWFDNKGTVPSINNNLLRHETVYLPNIEEQQKIAAFLDEKVSHIDNIIEDTKKSIENLKVYKQSLITETVTKGVNPNVEMRDSGIEWIGKIPKHWLLVSLNHLSVSYSGGTPKRNEERYWENGNIPWVSSGEVNKEVIFESDEKITIDGLNESSAKLFPAKTVIVALNGQGKTKGMSAILEIEAATNQSLVGFIPNEKLNYKYLHYTFVASYSYNRSYYAGGEKRDGIAAGNLKNRKIPLPSIKEQKDIVNFIFEKTNHINTLIGQKERLITELNSYKKSLIYEYVTGKKEVK